MGTGRKLHPCGHKSFGNNCHRCRLADKLEAEAALARPVVEAFDAARLQALRTTLLEEAARLRTVPTKGVAHGS